MKRITAKAARFAAVVQSCGAPRTATLWLGPEQDKDFMVAVRAKRIMTIIRENAGSKKDFGLIGFHNRPAAIYLVFPRSLKDFTDRRIVGINYDLIKEPDVQPRDAVAAQTPPVRPRRTPRLARPLASKREHPAPPPEPPKQRRFIVKLRSVATVIQALEVNAMNKAEAKSKAMHDSNPDWSAGQVRRSVFSVQEC